MRRQDLAASSASLKARPRKVLRETQFSGIASCGGARSRRSIRSGWWCEGAPSARPGRRRRRARRRGPSAASWWPSGTWSCSGSQRPRRRAVVARTIPRDLPTVIRVGSPGFCQRCNRPVVPCSCSPIVLRAATTGERSRRDHLQAAFRSNRPLTARAAGGSIRSGHHHVGDQRRQCSTDRTSGKPSEQCGQRP
jgi:hypothetical protein